jgi:hypothetical protein
MKPSSNLIVWVQGLNHVLVQSAKNAIKTAAFPLEGPGSNEQFAFECLGNDLIDRVVAKRSEKRQIERPLISLWSCDRSLEGDVMLDVIGLGPSEETPNDEEISGAKKKTYEVLGINNLLAIRQMLKANHLVKPELEVISLFLECGKDMQKLKLRLMDTQLLNG